LEQAVRSVLGNYATFGGRASRSEIWWWILAVILFLIVLRLVDATLIAPILGFERFGDNAGQPLSVIASLALIIPNFAVGVRRLHDTDRVGWWILLHFIPLVGTLVLLSFFVQPSDEGENSFGPPNPL